MLPQRRAAADSMHSDDDECLEEDASGWETASDEDDRAAGARGHEDASTSEASMQSLPDDTPSGKSVLLPDVSVQDAISIAETFDM